ncbi:hypothetical protein NL676_037194 [Syzygium grande]|nr:hypothetical protein NL676_037194 [Syzygium grande]
MVEAAKREVIELDFRVLGGIKSGGARQPKGGWGWWRGQRQRGFGGGFGRRGAKKGDEVAGPDNIAGLRHHSARFS